MRAPTDSHSLDLQSPAVWVGRVVGAAIKPATRRGVP